MNLSKVSDEILRQEYIKRFTISAGESIRSSESAANHLRTFLADASKQERFIICFLNGQNQVIATEVLFTGTLTASAVYPREVVARVLDLGAAAVLLGHNHPSGCIHPSPEDQALTRKISSILKLIDVQVLDHLIVGGDGHYSFADNGII